MNVAPTLEVDHSDGVTQVDAVDGFAAFLEPQSAATVWARKIPAAVQAWLNGLTAEQLPHGRVVISVDAISSTVTRFCDEADVPVGPEREWLEQDIASLAAFFADVMSAKMVRLRLDVVVTNACRKFHVDAIMGRLICTYRGTGTQYGVAQRAGTDPEFISTVPTGAPVLLRGSLWPPEPQTGLLHRSPPIEGTGEARLLLVVDPIFDDEGEM